eukprot:CAMPEP_0172535092 /NCGR_PEP_ID=MMETSP1067-20121228/7245_1 /TAXON_ID=265564 ORGANISM="Thalassiosira punctigera, Strain Tpunct2005C2" /NCGR_SAMPLE_ID=MMETSP1067 /ASSEMBLY_ACC=CAM_ASM_000444 /LENGTH=33 /DNA_ID= /DNA_START= /DNA_END= /DNA_ORIENTATION=
MADAKQNKNGYLLDCRGETRRIIPTTSSNDKMG